MACSSGVQDELGCHRGAGPPTQDAAGVGVDDEGDVDPARPGRHVGQVGHPEPVRRQRREPASPPDPGQPSGRVGDRGAFHLAADRPGQAEPAHQPLHRAAGHLDAFTVQLQPDLPGAGRRRSAPLAPGRRAGPRAPVSRTSSSRPAPVEMVVVGGRGDRQAMLGQHGADRLDTPDQATGFTVAAGGCG